MADSGTKIKLADKCKDAKNVLGNKFTTKMVVKDSVVKFFVNGNSCGDSKITKKNYKKYMETHVGPYSAGGKNGETAVYELFDVKTQHNKKSSESLNSTVVLV